MIQIITFSILIFTSQIFAQLSSSSLTQIYNATSVSLGEASVANKNYGIPSNINPALLSEQENMIVYYNQRSMNWIESLNDMVFLSALLRLHLIMRIF